LASRDCSSALLAYSGQDEFLERAEPTHRIAELVKAIGVIGLAGVRVMVGPDRLDNWDSIRPGLSALLSSLNLLKEPRFIYKLVLPADKGRGLLSTTGVERRRLEVILLQWFEPELVAIVEKRIALATDNKATRLEDLCEDNKLIEWLTRYGGYLPRGWLEQTRTLISHYFTRGRTLTIREWEEIRRRRPPRLVVNLETGRVAIGELEIKDIGQVELALLRYLYQHRDRICTREELYYQAYYPSVYPGQTAKHIPPKDYEGVLDTALWRLRGAVEPDPKHPIFVITRRGKGVQLDNAW
jgi:DNA-binding winged helix-turn-helix (wHTH) protein